MKLVLFYIVLAISLVETAIFLFKECYRSKRSLELRREMLGLPWKDNLMRHHDLSVEIAKISLLPVNVRSFPNKVKEGLLPFCIIVNLLLAGIILCAASATKTCPPSAVSLAIIASWTAYRLLMAVSDRFASAKNSLSNAIRVEKFAEDRTLISRVCMAFSLILGLIVYYAFS